jgi:catechol 2,3-dioxygenase-like lactoylglutathione lyase family enzyme
MACCPPNSSTNPAPVAEATAPPTGSIAAPKAHVHLHVPDLAKAVAFYRAFFGSNPVKTKPGYAKFLPIWGPLNLALSEQPAASHGSIVSHLGIQLTSPAAVRAHLQRLKAAGLPVREEMGVTCCHSNQDKFWVTDPAGIEWEVYHINFDVDETTNAAESPSACCAR